MPVPHIVPVDDNRDSRADPVVRTLLMTDLVGSTRLVERLGDDRAYEVATRHDRAARDLLHRFRGLEIDKTDGFLLLFERPIDAVACALAYHRTLSELSRELGVELVARAGIHLGEVILRENSAEDVARGAKPLEVEGLAKPTAARVMGLARGGQTLLTRGVFDLARRSAVGRDLPARQVSWLAHGSYRFKGVGDPLEIFEVGTAGAAPLSVPPDTEKAHRVVGAGDELILGWRPAPDLSIPQRPHWILQQRIGIGGFGEVWLAVHEKTQEKRVFKFCLDARRLRSLKREITLFRLLKEALGHRDDIARVLDCNFDEAPYFLESEYTEGGSLVEWAGEQGGLAEVPLATRLELVAQVADALAAAHSVGVLHKDVKPANVLVKSDRDGRPRIQLTDFGIGRVMDERVLSDHGITLLGMTEVLPAGEEAMTGGTYLYMAPEVIEGKVGTVQADIYALGIMLYQMVVGDFSHPLSPGWRRDVSDEILAEDIARLVDGSPERRPGSAAEVADGLRRLEQRRAEVVARRAQERAHRRWRLFAAFGAAASIVLVVVSVLALRATNARRDADLRRSQAEDLISFMLGDLRGKLRRLGRLEILNDIGDKAMAYFEAVPEDQLTDRELLRRSDALMHIGEVRLAEAKSHAAMAAFEESILLAQDLVVRDPENTEYREALGTRYFWAARVLWEQGDFEAALDSWRTQLSIAEDLARRDPQDTNRQLQIAYANNNIGFALAAQGLLEKALAEYRSSLAVKKTVIDPEQASSDRKLELANQHNLVGSVLFKLGQLDAAMEHLHADHQIALEMTRAEPHNTIWQERLVTSHNYLGRIAETKGDHTAARDHFQQALAIADGLVAQDPDQTDWQRSLAIAHRRLGLNIKTSGAIEAALTHVRSALTILKSLVAMDRGKVRWQRDLATAHIAFGELHQLRGAAQEARTQAEAAVTILEEITKKNPNDLQSHADLGAGYLLLGNAFTVLDAAGEARKAFARARDIVEPIAQDSKDIFSLQLWARILLRVGREEEATQILHELRTLGLDLDISAKNR